MSFVHRFLYYDVCAIFLNKTSDYITEKEPLTNSYISLPKDRSKFLWKLFGLPFLRLNFFWTSETIGVCLLQIVYTVDLTIQGISLTFFMRLNYTNRSIVDTQLSFILLYFSGNINCAAFTAGTIEAFLVGSNFVSIHSTEINILMMLIHYKAM